MYMMRRIFKSLKAGPWKEREPKEIKVNVKKIPSIVICGKNPGLLPEQPKPKWMQQKMVVEEDKRNNKDAKMKTLGYIVSLILLNLGHVFHIVSRTC